VYSCVPGCGVTTVAAGLAFALAEKRPGKVALAEVGAGVPELALYLDLAPRHTIADLAGSWDRLDRTMLAQALAEHAGGVHVLAHQAETLTAAPLPVQPMQQTLLLLRATFEYAVLDLGHALEPSVVQALKLVETVFFVIHLDVPALRLARRVLHQLAVEHGVSPERVQVVANRAGQRGLISKKQAEETLGRPIVEEIPDDPGTVNEAINNGAPLIRAARRAGITRSFDRLATRLETVA
jgi:pilus assembly protein CpaE